MLLAGALSVLVVAAGCSRGSDQVSSPVVTELPLTEAPSITQAASADGDATSTSTSANPGRRAGETAAAADNGIDDGPVDDKDDNDKDDKAMVDRPNPVDTAGPELLDVVEPLDDAPTPDEAIGIRDGQRINEAGEANQLDQSASLACGDVEIALTALDEGRSAAARGLLASAAQRASVSSNTSISGWHDELELAANLIPDDDPEPTSLFGFLTSCTQGGYEL